MQNLKYLRALYFYIILSVNKYTELYTCDLILTECFFLTEQSSVITDFDNAITGESALFLPIKLLRMFFF